ncbi:MAG: adenylate/guanylate cyclase domain-containing protein [Proteobacteria bacterium]|nr:adenylate/guanylate cyclase domain-containing protein [Pseudomonadota bacterium]
MMEIQVAHLRIQGTDFIFVPFSSSMARLSAAEQSAVLGELRTFCRSAGLVGEVVPVWQGTTGTSYLSDPRHHAALSKTISLEVVQQKLNRRLAAPGASATLASVTRASSSSAQAPTQRSAANRVATMVFSDIVGSTKLKQELGDARSMEVLKHHHALVRQLLKATATGEEVSTAGDSFFISFSIPSEAVTFALRWQDKIRDFSHDEGVNLQDRIGIHVGEVYTDNSKSAGKDFDLNGIQVDTAARIMSLAQGNQILLSQFAFVNAKQMLEGFEFEGLSTLAWRSYGPYVVKGVDMPIDIYEVGEAGLACLKPPPDSEKAKRFTR